jgi:hypothetical protein
MIFQSAKNPNVKNFETPNLRVPRKNYIWMHPLWLITENTIKGRWWLPPSLGHGESCESVYACGSFVHQKLSNYTLTNLFGLCRYVWIIDLLIIHPIPNPKVPTHPSTPKVLRIRERTPIFYFVIFTFRFAFESFKEFGSASLWFIHKKITNSTN